VEARAGKHGPVEGDRAGGAYAASSSADYQNMCGLLDMRSMVER
jgi:hypothetical protein